MSETAAVVNIIASDNVTLNDAFRFGTVGDTSWDLTGQNFKLEVKADADDTSPLLTLSTAAGSIVVDDVTQRVIHLNCSEAALQAALAVGEYVYDLVMFDASVPPVRVKLMEGTFTVTRGVTED